MLNILKEKLLEIHTELLDTLLLHVEKDMFVLQGLSDEYVQYLNNGRKKKITKNH